MQSDNSKDFIEFSDSFITILQFVTNKQENIALNGSTLSS